MESGRCKRTALDGWLLADGFQQMAIVDGLWWTGQPSASIRRPWRTALACAGRPPLPTVRGQSALPSTSHGGQRTADGQRPPWWTFMGSSNASGRSTDANVDVQTRNNPVFEVMCTAWVEVYCYMAAELSRLHMQTPRRFFLNSR